MKGVALALLMVPGAALAAPAGWPDLPARESCDAVVTVQKSNCSVEHVFRCPGDVQLSEEQDVGETSVFTGYARPALTSWAFADPLEDFYVLTPDQSPAMGVDDVTGGTLAPQTGKALVWTPIFVEPMTGTASVSYAVEETGQVVDGETLTRLRGEILIDLNGGLLRFGGWEHVYVDVARGITFAGTNEVSFGMNAERNEESPVKLIFPGEAGFLEPPAEGDCEMIGMAVPSDLPWKGRAMATRVAVRAGFVSQAAGEMA